MTRSLYNKLICLYKISHFSSIFRQQQIHAAAVNRMWMCVWHCIFFSYNIIIVKSKFFDSNSCVVLYIHKKVCVLNYERASTQIAIIPEDNKMKWLKRYKIFGMVFVLFLVGPIQVLKTKNIPQDSWKWKKKYQN